MSTNSSIPATREAVILLNARNGSRTLQVRTEDGSLKMMHSRYDPEAEARSLVDAFGFGGRGPLVVLGLGMGYHVAELSRRFPGTEIHVIELSPEIRDCQTKYGPRLDGGITVRVGLAPDQLRKEMDHLRGRSPAGRLTVFALPSAVSSFPDYYGPILASLRSHSGGLRSPELRYPKFEGRRVAVALLDLGYYLGREVESAITGLGHTLVRIPIRKGDEGEPAVRTVLDQVRLTRPDFLLTINHLGFDKAGLLASALRQIEMPAAAWYVDNPNLIVKGFEANVSPYVSVFLWDRGYLQDLHTMGFEDVVYLPLATDDTVFKPMKLDRTDLKRFACDAGFVGNSMLEPVRRWLDRIPHEHHPRIEGMAANLAARRMSVGQALDDAGELRNLSGCGECAELDLQGAVLWRATLLYRLACVQALAGFDHRIFGDEGWGDLLDRQYRIEPRINYYAEAPKFYNACTVNLNATSLQMGSAVNQRVFDVPACGGFLLTDWQDALAELFEPSLECVCYREPAEIPELVSFFLRRPAAARRVSRKARQRVLKEHTYQARLGEMIRHMRERYGTRTGAAHHYAGHDHRMGE